MQSIFKRSFECIQKSRFLKMSKYSTKDISIYKVISNFFLYLFINCFIHPQLHFATFCIRKYIFIVKSNQHMGVYFQLPLNLLWHLYTTNLRYREYFEHRPILSFHVHMNFLNLNYILLLKELLCKLVVVFFHVCKLRVLLNAPSIFTSLNAKWTRLKLFMYNLVHDSFLGPQDDIIHCKFSRRELTIILSISQLQCLYFLQVQY